MRKKLQLALLEMENMEISEESALEMNKLKEDELIFEQKDVKQIEKIASFSFNGWPIDLVEAASHKAITLGFSVFIKKPVINNLMLVVLDIFTPDSSFSSFLYRLKNK